MPELLYFGYLIGFLIQYLIIEKKAELKGILETILFITFAVIPTFFFMIESSKHEKILKDI
jgi:hypothetical protein